jgi:hypothetical protein
MLRVVLLVLVIAVMLVYVETFAQDSAAKGKVAKEPGSASTRALEKPTKKDSGTRSSPKHDGFSLQTEDVWTYLLENRGKVPLVSGMNGKVQVELGLFGYLGLKYQF